MLEAGEDDDFEVSVRAPYMLNLKLQTRYLGFRIQYNLHETGFEHRGHLNQLSKMWLPLHHE